MRDDPDGNFAFSDGLTLEEKEQLVFKAWKSLVSDFAKLKMPWGTKDNPGPSPPLNGRVARGSYGLWLQGRRVRT